jgi:hypothetical protein
MCVLHEVHRKICKSLETQKEYDGSRRVFFQVDANQDGEVHREDTCVGKKHDISYVWLATYKRVQILLKGKPMIEKKDGKARSSAEDFDLRQVGFLNIEKYKVSEVKKAVVYCKKISNLALCNLGRRDRLIVDFEALGRKLFQTPYFSPIEVPNDKTLAPVYP